MTESTILALYIIPSLTFGFYIHKFDEKWREEVDISVERGYLYSFITMAIIFGLTLLLFNTK